MNILHICTDFWPSTGGIEKFVLDLARYSRDAGLTPHILCFNRIHRSREVFAAIDRVREIPVRRIPFLDLRYYKPTWLPLAELRWADILHVHGIGAPLDFAAVTKCLHRRPIVLSTHGGIFHTADLWFMKHLYFGGIHRLVQQLVDRTVACSQQDWDLFRPVAKNLTLIENGVDLAPFRACDDIKTNPDAFVSIGRLSRNKRADNLIRTFACLRELRPAALLRVVGPDWEGLGPSLQSLAESLGLRDTITFTGPVEDAQLIQELRAASAFLSASEYEGFGISAVEAMAAGCIPILNVIPAFRHLVRSGENGLLVDFSQPQTAAGQIDQFLTALTPHVRAAARSRAEDFAWEKQTQKWKQLYEGVVRT